MYQCEVSFKDFIKDPIAEKIKEEIKKNLGIEITSCKRRWIYLIESKISKERLDFFKNLALLDPIIQEETKIKEQDFNYCIQISPLFPSDDHTATTCKITLQELEQTKAKVARVSQYLIKGEKISKEDARAIAEVLTRPTGETVEVYTS